MADGEDPSDLFAIPDLWRPSTWLDQTFTDNKGPPTPNPLFALAEPDASQGLINVGDAQVAPGTQDDGHVFFKLPSLLQELASQHVNPVLAQTTTAISSSSNASEDHHQILPEPSLCSSDDDDFWLSPDNDTSTGSQFQTWEAFRQPEDGQGAPLFISEAGPAAFDALLASKQTAGSVPDILPFSLYCACLLNLALGRSSLLFFWDASKNSFVKTGSHLRISGLSLDLVSAVDALCLDCGNSARHLQAFAEKTYSAATTPTRVALASVVGRLVEVVRSELSTRGCHARSVLQLQSAVQPIQSVFAYFKSLVKKLSQQKSDEALLSCLFREAQASEYRNVLLQECTREVLRILSRPWIDFVEEWIGLRTEEGVPMDKKGPGRGFVKIADKMWIDDQGFELEEADYFLDEDKLPTFVPEDMGQVIFEAGRNLRFLREHHPEHPLSRPDVVSRAAPARLEWEFEWDAISKLETRVNQYRDALTRAIQGFSPTMHTDRASPGTKKRKFSAAELEYFGKDEAHVEASIIASINQLNQPLEDAGAQDALTRLLRTYLYQSTDNAVKPSSLSPHSTLVPLLSFGPIIDAQSSLVSRECMRLLFSAHHLRTHIDLLRQYFLLGNGLLCSRLTHALFDPNLSSAERRASVALGGGTMGLRLGGRHTWPPASSELRLALMGVLSECYQPASAPAAAAPTRSRSRASSPDLPGDLSFAVRDLSPEEIDRCMDPDSLEALDFLRLSYRPPPPLRAILPPTTLLRYDRIFRLLLRVLRMLFVADQLCLRAPTAVSAEAESNASLRLRIEARHFVKQVAAHFFDAGVAAPWKRFEAWLDDVQAQIQGQGQGQGQAGDRSDSRPAHFVSVSRPASGARDGPPTTAATGTARAREPTGRTQWTCTPDGVRERQERALDEIMGVLLLRKRQAPVMGLLEEIFGVVLRFAKGLRLKGVRRVDGTGGGGDEGETPEELYALFRKKVEVFVTVCRGLGEKMAASSSASYSSAGSRREQNGVEQLLLRLDMAGFYGRRMAG